jgi:hypothetical protein
MEFEDVVQTKRTITTVTIHVAIRALQLVGLVEAI